MDKDRTKAFADKVFADMAGAMTAGMGYVGVKTGLFRAMAGKGSMRAEEVAREANLVPRYVEEWLKGMASARYLDYDPATQTYCLPEEHAFLLASEGTDHFMGGLFPMVPVLLRIAPDVASAFARGGGVAFEKFGAEGVFGLDVMNRGQYEQRLTSYWLNAMPDVRARLEAGGRALDVGCGAAGCRWRWPRRSPRRPWSVSIRTGNQSIRRRRPPPKRGCRTGSPSSPPTPAIWPAAKAST